MLGARGWAGFPGFSAVEDSLAMYAVYHRGWALVDCTRAVGAAAGLCPRPLV